MGDWGTALVVGARAAESFSSTLATRFAVVEYATSMTDALERVESKDPIEFALVDVDGVDGGVWVAVSTARKSPRPLVFAVHSAPVASADAFLLGRWGIDRLLDGSLGADALLAELDGAMNAALPDVAHVVAPFVGRWPLYEFEERAREAFVHEAINRTAANRSRAARLLQVPRPIVQRVLHKGDAHPPRP